MTALSPPLTNPRSDSRCAPRDQDLAVIGLACRFPGATDVDAFLELLRAGREGVSHFTPAELIAAGIDPALVARPDYVPAHGILPDPGRFDAAFFGYSPREAELLDVQQRVFLETAWTALEHAGYNPTRLDGPCGVFAGSGFNTYLLHHIAANPAVVASAGGFQVMLANDKDHLATRVAYKLNLTGPALTLATACSTSLVAVHQAAQSLLAGECDLALAGGVSIRLPQVAGYLHQQGMILSPDGHCRAFAADAAGTVGGNGVGAVVLKRAADAMADGDTIHAIMRGSAINNDGAAKVGYTAPGPDGQAAVIAQALAVAEVSAAAIGYVEAHGTGTKLGDPIEIAALTRVFRRDTDRRAFCALGAVKTNLGHLDAAAGIAGFIKTVLSLREREFFPTLHHHAPHPAIDFAASPFTVATVHAPWPAPPDGHPRRAGVSSFGIGGTNAHVILEEAPAPPVAPPPPPGDATHLFVISARTPAARDQLGAALARYPYAGAARDAAFTLARGRSAFAHRGAFHGPNLATAREVARDDAGSGRRVAWLFPGQGSQTPGMAAALHAADPLFRRTLDDICARFQPHLDGVDLRALLLADPADEAAATTLARTELTQPALFALGHALAIRWFALGLTPAALLGHSIGEWVAATLAGVFSLEDVLPLVAQRGRLMAAQAPGAMLAVGLEETAARTDLPPALTVAALNAPDQTVLSGPAAAIAAHAAALAARGVSAMQLRTSHAFHSPAMAPAAEALGRALAGVKLSPPQIPFVSNVTGTWITTAEATDPAYWARQLLAPVRFADGVAALLGDGPTLLLEMGPGRTALGLARRHAAWNDTHRAISLTGTDLSAVLAKVWCAGGAVDWSHHYADRPARRVPLPTYPFGGEVYWIHADSPLVGDRRPPSEWLHLPAWQRVAAPIPTAPVDAGSWHIIGGPPAWSEALGRRLQSLGANLGALAKARWVIDLRGLEGKASFDSLRITARELAARPLVPGTRLLVVTAGLASLAGEQTIDPAAALLLGPTRVLPREAPDCAARLVDLVSGTPATPALVDTLISEARAEDENTVVLWRRGVRWTETLTPQPTTPAPLPAAHGLTLVTGGRGGLGGVLATTLGERVIRLGRQPSAEPGYRAIDVTDRAALITLRDELGKAGTPVTRILHAAGLPASGTLLRASAAATRSVLAPKVAGTRALWDVFGPDLRDGFILMSSLSARLGEFGQSDYAAANAFLDAFALAHHTPERPVISLAWDAWADVGMAARLADAPGIAAHHAARRPWLITPAEGLTALAAALATREPHVLIATHPLDGRTVTPPRDVTPTPSSPAPRHPRPDLATPYVAPGSPDEQRLTELWGELLGIAEVGANDNFFDLGGHSLLATQLIARLRDTGLTLATFFDHPTPRALANHLTTLTAEESAAPTPRPDPAAPAPLSFAQQSLWLLDRMEGTSAHYNELGAQRIRGPLDPGRLETALRQVIARHPGLRTRFAETDGEAAQYLLAPEAVELDWDVLDWSTRPADEHEGKLTALVAEMNARPFDLGRAPLLRSRLIRLGPAEHVLATVVHHIVFDGWSSRLFVADMLAAYAGTLPPAPTLTYADYAVWQRTWLAGPRLAALQSHWRDQLTPLPPPLDLPTDFPRPPRQDFTGARHPLVLPAQLTSDLREFARAQNASLFMALLTAYGLVLARQAAQEKLVIGSPVAGRDHRDLEPLIGYFVNPLPLVLDLSGNPTCAELLARTSRTVLAAFAHQDLPFGQIVESVTPPRDSSRHPLFQVMLIFQNRTTSPVPPDDFVLESWVPSFGPARTDLDLYLWENAAGLAGHFLYARALFSPATLHRLSDRLLAVLNLFVSHADTPIDQLSLQEKVSLPRLGAIPARRANP